MAAVDRDFQKRRPGHELVPDRSVGGALGSRLVTSTLLTGQIFTLWQGGIRIVVFLFQEFIQVVKYMLLGIVQTVMCWRRMLKCMSFDPEEKRKFEEVHQEIDLMTL